MSREAFEADQKARLGEFEPILGREAADIGWNPEETRAMAGDLDIPKNIDPATFRGWVTVSLIVEYTEDGDNLRCFDLDILVVDDRGALKAGHIDYVWCD